MCLEQIKKGSDLIKAVTEIGVSDSMIPKVFQKAGIPL
jgi:hypothetical protein